ncbi:MAG TPA: DUF2190 family protein [Phycisphaerae bacterium]|nr:DUF2190 family protein [Phycisphaerae bacterium]
MTTFVHEGNTIDYTPGSAVAAGDVVVQGELVGVAPRAIAANELGSLAVSGVFDFPKDTSTGSGSTAGTVYYWDKAAEVATTDSDSGNNKLIGKSVADCDDADETVRVRMDQ